ncbi:nickel ABC transporter permease subunit NikC [Clostridium sp. P21]|uniref:Nickel ABC transporter permease subunit NikC n=1 Tax=Clostridium muellerianum TaxID=2716538 RepID=A0A7Y0HP73_9CLOT|nr:nickel/cobalt ABC transporter permease [Clostridium muellerianum]NMM63422.1 nickel ABC transporter permease subunit NikC [Clostridium muellerianum]
MILWKRLKSDKLAVVCIIILFVILLAGVLAPVITPNSPIETNITQKFQSMSMKYPFGTDQLGRCLFSRILYGVRTTVILSILTMIITILIGTILGMISGFFGGFVDEIIMRICDIMLSFPSEVMILSIVGILGPGLFNVIIANIIAKWVWYTRMIRSIVLQYRDKNYIKFARVSGCSTWHIIKKHLVPGVAGEIIVLATLDTGWVILNISALSFLGLGVQPPIPEWGMMLNEAKNIMTTHPTQMLPAGIAILVVVAAFNFLGDSLQVALDPKKHGKLKEVIK